MFVHAGMAQSGRVSRNAQTDRQTQRGLPSERALKVSQSSSTVNTPLLLMLLLVGCY